MQLLKITWARLLGHQRDSSFNHRTWVQVFASCWFVLRQDIESVNLQGGCSVINADLWSTWRMAKRRTSLLGSMKYLEVKENSTSQEVVTLTTTRCQLSFTVKLQRRRQGKDALEHTNNEYTDLHSVQWYTSTSCLITI